MSVNDEFLLQEDYSRRVEGSKMFRHLFFVSSNLMVSELQKE